jgi:hypothetical protein
MERRQPMANLFFPQLSSGALAQYPIRKMRVGRTIKNLLPDGTVCSYLDTGADRMVWELTYSELSTADLALLRAHFAACSGPFRAFTFIDPTDNMLTSSLDPTAEAWIAPSQLTITAGLPDPNGGDAACTLTNTGQTPATLQQSLAVPSGYQYCFSFWAMSAQPAGVTVFRNGAAVQASAQMNVASSWTRFTSSGSLNDPGAALTVGITLAPGQQIAAYGFQLEPQIVPSGYRPTSGRGGVYATAHWAAIELPVVAQAPGLFSTSFSIEAPV